MSIGSQKQCKGNSMEEKIVLVCFTNNAETTGYPHTLKWIIYNKTL